MDKLLLTPEEAARAIGLGRTKVYELLPAGALESVQIGAARRVPAEALREYVDRLRSCARESAA
jgi:excisionase family DNA binding protein